MCAGGCHQGCRRPFVSPCVSNGQGDAMSAVGNLTSSALYPASEKVRGQSANDDGQTADPGGPCANRRYQTVSAGSRVCLQSASCVGKLGGCPTKSLGSHGWMMHSSRPLFGVGGSPGPGEQVMATAIDAERQGQGRWAKATRGGRVPSIMARATITLAQPVCVRAHAHDISGTLGLLASFWPSSSRPRFLLRVRVL